MTIAHAAFEQAFTTALLAADDAGPAVAIYRNTVLKGCIDALEANFPTVQRLVGAAWLRSAAARFARQQPPADARLLYYGRGFDDFLAGLPSTAGLPWLPGVAWIDQAWRECEAAADAAVLPAHGLAALSPDQLARAVLRVHPAARWCHFGNGPSFAIWSQQRLAAVSGSDAPFQPEASADGVLLTRPVLAVQTQALTVAGCRFLDACVAGQPLAQAAFQALTHDTRTDLATLLQDLLRAGAFATHVSAETTP